MPGMDLGCPPGDLAKKFARRYADVEYPSRCTPGAHFARGEAADRGKAAVRRDRARRLHRVKRARNLGGKAAGTATRSPL